MIRQAHTYLVGAMSGATLIAIAIAAFVLLVSAQVFRDWPVAALGDDDSAAVSNGQPAAGQAGSTTTGAGAQAAGGATQGGGATDRPGADAVSGPAPGPATGQPVSSGQPGSGAGGGGGSGNSAPAQSPSSPSSSGSGAGKTSGGGGGSGRGTTQGSSPSSQVTETANNAVNQVDETALGGTLKESGVTEATEGVVKGVVGPESTVGHAVDETVGAVGGLLPGNR
jgi:hypothetical protein